MPFCNCGAGALESNYRLSEAHNFRTLQGQGRVNLCSIGSGRALSHQRNVSAPSVWALVQALLASVQLQTQLQVATHAGPSHHKR